nr:uncharacterized protein LOC128687183 [Cherax quadricarinatus]
MTSINHYNISLEDKVVSQTSDEKQSCHNRKLPANSLLRTVGVSTVSPFEEAMVALLLVDEQLRCRPCRKKTPTKDDKRTQKSQSNVTSINAENIMFPTADIITHNAKDDYKFSFPVSKRLCLLKADIMIKPTTRADTNAEDLANEQSPQLPSEKSSLGSDTSETGALPPHTSPAEELIHLPEQASFNQTERVKANIDIVSNASLKVDENDDGSVLMSQQILPDRNLTEERDKDPTDNVSPQSLHEQVLPDLKTDDGGWQPSSDNASAQSDKSEDENSESLLKGMTFDPVHEALNSSAFHSSNITQKINELKNGEINDHSLLQESINLSSEQPTRPKNNLASNTNCVCNSESPNNVLPNKKINPATNSPQQSISFQVLSSTEFESRSQIHQTENMKLGIPSFDTTMPHKDTLESALSPSSPRLSNIVVGRTEELLPICATYQYQYLGNILDQHEPGGQFCDLPNKKMASSDHIPSKTGIFNDGTTNVIGSEIKSYQPLIPNDPPFKTTVSGDKLHAKAELQDDTAANGLHDNELQQVVVSESKQPRIETADDDLQKGHGVKNKSGSKLPMIEVTSDGHSWEKPPFKEVKRQDYEVADMPQGEPADVTSNSDELEVIMSIVQTEGTISEDELWETDVPEVIIPDDDLERIAVPDVPVNHLREISPVKSVTEAALISDATMQDVDGSQEVTMTEDTLPPDVTMLEELSVDEDLPSQTTDIQENSIEIMAVPECEISGSARESQDNRKGVMSITCEPTREEIATQRVSGSTWSEDWSGDITMLDIASSDHELSLSLDYNSDDFTW